MQEGFADALAGLMSLRRGYDSSSHVLFNRTATVTNIDMTVPRRFYEAYGNASRARQVVGNFFYRLSQQPGVSRNQQSEVIFRAIAFLSPTGGQLGSSSFDTDDFIAAVEDASSHNSSLESAVDTVVNQMDTDPISTFNIIFRNATCLGGIGSVELGVGFASGAPLYYLTASNSNVSGLSDDPFDWYSTTVNPNQYYLFNRLQTTYYRGLACRVIGPNPFGPGNAYACNFSGSTGTRINSCI